MEVGVLIAKVEEVPLQARWLGPPLRCSKVVPSRNDFGHELDDE
jgi:hypothetical protein